MAEDSSQMLKKYRELLRKSPTAYSPGTTPTSRDTFLQRQVKGLERSEGMAESQRLKEQWYTERSPGAEPKDEQGMIGKALNLLMTPGYVVTGAIESALGKGTEKGLVKNIKANIKERGTMGDLIRSYGVNNYVAMPLGLALDIALDPLAWATLGTSAIVPRTAIGALKASKTGGSALKGARLGAESSLLGKVAWTGKATSAVGKKFGITGETKGLSRFAGLQKAVSERALKTSGQYDKITGEGLEKIVKHSQRDRLLDKASRALDKTDFGRGLKHIFEMSSKKQVAATKASDELATTVETGKRVVGKDFNEVGDVLFKSTKISGKDIRPAEIVSSLSAEKKAADRMAKQVQEEIKNIKYLLEKDSVALERFTGMSKKEAKEVAELVGHYKIGVDKYDKSVAKVLMGTKARKFFNSYAIYTGWFKNMKIGLNPATRMNALVGNLAMSSMAGIDIASSGMMRSTKNAIEMVTKKNSKFLKPFMEENGFYEAIKKYPTVWENVTGIRAGVILGGRAHMDDIIETMTKSNKFKSADINAVKKEVSETFTREWNIGEGLRSTVRTTAGAQEGTFFSAEFMTGPYTKFLEKLKTSKNPVANFIYKTSTVSMESYNKIDQTNRVALTLNLGVEGISRKELKLLSNRFVLEMKDVTKVGEKFKLSPMKSLEIAQAVYMNYAAMPPFVKAMRTLPLVGHPFACRSEDTEVLTNNGWKYHNELCPDDLALSYNLEGKFLEWQPIIAVHRYDLEDAELYHIKGRSLDIIASADHDMVVAYRENIEKGKVDGKRIRKQGEFLPQKMKMKKLFKTSVPSIVVGAENGFKAVKFKVVSNEIVELVGWFVTEGYYRYKRNSGEYGSFGISQSKPEGVSRIKDLIRRMGVKCNVGIRKKEKVLMANYDCYVFNFSAELKRILDIFSPKKQLTISFLNLLTKEQLRLLYDTMILADGTVSKADESERFFQNPGETLDSFQVLTLMVGKSCTNYGERKIENINNVVIGCNKKLYRQIKRNRPKKIKYTGKIWCPQVLGNGTWVARRNGRIDITGNSFAYGMTGIAAETAMYNPMFYNKMSYLLHEISGEKSPLEKQALESGYYQWLQKPGMMKVPFFEENPIYLNTANMIPHYTMNLLQPPERDYESRYGRAVASLIDKTPFFKTPDGQVMLDYIIMPTILQGERPQGMFGQPLWEKDAGLAGKAGYATRSLIESVLPPALGYAGLGVKAGIPSEGSLPYMPHYRLRQLGYATKGKSSLGIKGDEPASEKTARVMAAMAGLPYYPVKLQYAEPKKK